MKKGVAMRYRAMLGVAILYLFGLSPLALGAGQDDVPAIDPEADKLLRHAAAYLQNAKQFTYHIEATFDDIPSSGPRLQYAQSVDIAVRRPDRFRVVTQDDFDTQQSFWYDGKTFTLFNQQLNYYATTQAPATIDATLNTLLDRFDISAPLSDLLYNDPALPLLEGVEAGRYIGVHRVHGVRCHHLVFVQEDVDWQVWIDAGETPVPRKVVMTYKRVEGSPQYTALLSAWNFDPKLDDSGFTFSVPKGAEEIAFLPVENLITPHQK